MADIKIYTTAQHKRVRVEKHKKIRETKLEKKRNEKSQALYVACKDRFFLHFFLKSHSCLKSLLFVGLVKKKRREEC
jgi:hypothetical protein